MAGLKAQIDGIVSVSPGSPEIEFEGSWHSWGQLGDARRELAALLASAGLARDTRVAVVLRNRPEFVAAILELVAAEHCLVTLNPIFSDERLAADVQAVAAPAIVANRR